MATKNGNITFTPDELSKTFITYREKFVELPFLAMAELLQHVSIRTGIRNKEIISAMSGNFQMGNYKKDKMGSGDIAIKDREFETFFGNCVEPIDPNAIYQSIWGSNVTKGDALKNVPIVVQVCAYILKSMWENTLFESFTAKHDASDASSVSKWFNGFKTVIDNDIAGNNHLKEVLISEDLGNLSYYAGTKDTTTGLYITKENAEDVIKDFYWGADAKLRRQPLKLFISDTAYHNYTDAYQLNHGALPYNQEYTKKSLDGASNVEFVPLPFVPEDFLLLTPKNNIYCLFNQKTDDEGYIVEKSLSNHYDVDFIANAFFGTQFESVDKSRFKVWLPKPVTQTTETANGSQG